MDGAAAARAEEQHRARREGCSWGSPARGAGGETAPHHLHAGPEPPRDPPTEEAQDGAGSFPRGSSSKRGAEGLHWEVRVSGADHHAGRAGAGPAVQRGDHTFSILR